MKSALATLLLGLGPATVGLMLVLFGHRQALHQRVLLTGELTAATGQARSLDAIAERLAAARGGSEPDAMLSEAIAHAGSQAEREAYQAVRDCLKAQCEHPEAPLEKLSQSMSDSLAPAWEAADQSAHRANTFAAVGSVLVLLGPLLIALVRVGRRGKETAVDGSRQIELLLRERLEQLYAAKNQAGESARFAAFGELAAGLSHGLKTPIASVLAAAQLGQLKVGEAHPARAQLDEIIREAEGLLDQVQRFLRAAASVGPTRARVELKQLLDELSQTYSSEAKSRGLKFSTVAQADGTVAIDQALLEMALKNLIENALASSPPGGEVRVTASKAEAPARAGLDGAVPKASKWVALCVEDQGPGLPATARQGQTGVTSKSRGSGLGLAIARRVVERHGGALSLEDREGGGARVRVLLPWGETT